MYLTFFYPCTYRHTHTHTHTHTSLPRNATVVYKGLQWYNSDKRSRAPLPAYQPS